MPDLTFVIVGAEAVPHAATPQLAFNLRIASNPADVTIQTIALRSQILIETARRIYTADERDRLFDLFGESDRWCDAVAALLWTHAQAVVPRWAGETLVDLRVPCTFDFNVAATKYFDGLRAGELPLNFQFSGTVFYQDSAGPLQVTQIARDKEASYRLPVRTWADMMEHHYPNSAWLRIGRKAFDKLAAHKRRRGFATWDQAIDELFVDGPAAVRQ
jgi:hypothetical protein